MGASLADVTDVLRKQIEANAEMSVELKAITRALGQVVTLLEEIRDAGGMELEDDDDDGDTDEETAGLDGMVNTIAGQIREKIRAKGLQGLLNRKKKTNGAAPKELRGTTTTTE